MSYHLRVDCAMRYIGRSRDDKVHVKNPRGCPRNREVGLRGLVTCVT